MKDARDLAVSTSSAQALEHFETALTQFHSYTGDPLATMQQALQADPDFALAHLFNAFAMYHRQRAAVSAGSARVDRQSVGAEVEDERARARSARCS